MESFLLCVEANNYSGDDCLIIMVHCQTKEAHFKFTITNRVVVWFGLVWFYTKKNRKSFAGSPLVAGFKSDRQ